MSGYKSKLGDIPEQNFENETPGDGVIDKREGSLYDRLKKRIAPQPRKENEHGQA